MTITRPFYLGVYEVTQGEWKKVMHTTPWLGEKYVQDGADFPATYVSWDDATEFCKKLSALEHKTYRLPTEAEWEYACRAGTQTKYSFGDKETDLGAYAWYDGLFGNGNAKREQYPHAVGTRKPNPWGLFDMHGNAVEWCSDWLDTYYFEKSPPADPQGPETGERKSVRGGCWLADASFCSSSDRGSELPAARIDYLGFRVLCELK